MNQEKQMQINVGPEVSKGVYSNLAVISHSRTEFVIDFASVLPGLPKAEVCSRIIMNPEHCKRLLAALNDNIAKYESQFGSIILEEERTATYNLTDLNPGGTRS